MKTWQEEFFDEPIVKSIRDAIGDSDYDDLTLMAFEICHGMMAYACDYNAPDASVQDLFHLLDKYKYSEHDHHNWEENPYGEKVYKHLEATVKTVEPTWAKYIRGEK